MDKFTIKTAEEIKIMAEGGRKLARVRDETIKQIAAGMTTAEIDRIAEKLIREEGGEASFKMVPGYHHATCVNVNGEVVHGIPGKRLVVEGDIVGLDVGLLYKGWHTDTAMTVVVNSKFKAQNSKLDEFLEVGRKALNRAIEQARPGRRIADISREMQNTVEAAGYSVVKALTGHGIGRQLHEEPAIPCFRLGRNGQTREIVAGMVLAIEVIYNMGGSEVVYAGSDGWTIATADGKISGLFEHTVAVTKSGPEVLTAVKK